MTPDTVLVVGSGAREHALAWRLAQDPGVERVIVAPGNPLMSDVAEVRADVPAGDHARLKELCLAERVALTVVGPEAPLVAGLSDVLSQAGIPCFGPSGLAARLEGSKAFCRELCRKAGVRMAQGEAFGDPISAVSYARRLGPPLVVKADGLASGKGVVICHTAEEAEAAIRAALLERRFGAAGGRVVVERMLEGSEASVIALCDGRDCLLLPAARDHKRLLDDDEGPNTGGMGAYSPVPELGPDELRQIGRAVHVPVMAAMAARGAPFRGALFAGLMLTGEGPRLLEFNVRLGDPEAQAILPRLAVPLAPLLLAAARGQLRDVAAKFGVEDELVPARDEATVALTLASRGYPDAPRAGDRVRGIDEARQEGGLVFGGGLRRRRLGGYATAGGRVLSVVGRGPDVRLAAEAAWRAAEEIQFKGRQVRTDIGMRLPREVAAAPAARGTA
ncbi:MAG TPA: phosphoribosylamine--glycine ligase [Candidatus Limnocylindria bacterium]|nr:phosphoribosylamine--glycine ligase [Candidatus Limnocylindria bacterium]